MTSYSGGHLYVVPAAAQADVLSGRVDRALFDVTTLVAERRDDARSGVLPVIVRYVGTASAATTKARQAPLRGTTGSRVLGSIGARAVKVKKSEANSFWTTLAPGGRVSSAVKRISLDRRVTAVLDQSVPQIGAPDAWLRGLTGKGTRVAILDTGLDAGHPDLAGRIGASANFSEAPDTVDHIGHGTHVASITAGTGAASEGRYKGVAPEATLLNGKVLDDNGSGTLSGVIAGMEWATAQGADIVNLSLGSTDPSDGTDEVALALNRLSRDTGALFVVAAGNCSAARPATVTSPAAADEALAVGNLQRDGTLNETSCRGPRKGDGALKPEISAPGTDIVAARAEGTQLGEPVGDSYTTLTGTSMATPHVSGTAALLAQAHPEWTAAQLKARLISTADPQQARVDEEGAGRVDAAQATATGITVDTGELELGTLRWPYPNNDEISRLLTYHNPTGTAVRLQLATSFEPSQAAPRLSSTELIVPADGTAQVIVTADRTAAGAGYFSGRITATPDDADAIVTTVGWYAEPELYDLTVKGIARDGGHANADISIARLDGPPVDLGGLGLPLRDGVATSRLAPGRYVVTSMFGQDPTDTSPARFDLVVGEETHLTGNMTVLLDARRAKPVGLSAQGKPELAPREHAMGYSLGASDDQLSETVGVSSIGHKVAFGATPTRRLTTGTSEFAQGARLEVPPYRAKVIGSDFFDVRDFFLGPRFTGTKDLPLYDAGSGTAEELSGADGKLALIRLSTTDSRFSGDVAQAAEGAGAAGVLLYNPDKPGDGAVFPYWAFTDSGEVSIPVMRTSRATASALLEELKSTPRTVRVFGQAATPYVYDLAQSWPDGVPAVGEIQVPPEHLARVEESFGSHTPGTGTSEVRQSRSPAGAAIGGWLLPVFSTPAHPVSYVQANETKWSSLLIYDNGGPGETQILTSQRSYQPGERSVDRWLAPVHNSGLPAGDVLYGGVKRFEGGLLVQLSPFQHQHEYTAPTGDLGQLELERNGEYVASAPGTGLWAPVPDDAATYKATLVAERPSGPWKFSRRVKSIWSWTSIGGSSEVMPIVLADLDLPQSNALSQVRTGIPTVITIGLRHQAGSESPAAFTSARLELSYDGSRWSELKLVKTSDGRFTTTVTHPAGQAGLAPSLRLSATDAAGNKLEQEVTAAYGLTR